jgi:hypothetical protein
MDILVFLLIFESSFDHKPAIDLIIEELKDSAALNA